jgi:hypothetical protein
MFGIRTGLKRKPISYGACYIAWWQLIAKKCTWRQVSLSPAFAARLVLMRPFCIDSITVQEHSWPSMLP